MEKIDIEKIDDKTLVINLENEWQKSLNFPNDDYFEAAEVNQFFTVKSTLSARGTENKFLIYLSFWMKQSWVCYDTYNICNEIK